MKLNFRPIYWLTSFSQDVVPVTIMLTIETYVIKYKQNSLFIDSSIFLAVELLVQVHFINIKLSFL